MPDRFLPLNSSSSLPNVIAQINRNFSSLDSESTTKVFKNSGAQLIQGRAPDGVRFGTLMQVNGVDRYFTGLYRDGRFGTISYDEAGVPVALDGMAPDDGRVGKWVVKPGQNVLTQLGG